MLASCCDFQGWDTFNFKVGLAMWLCCGRREILAISSVQEVGTFQQPKFVCDLEKPDAQFWAKLNPNIGPGRRGIDAG